MRAATSSVSRAPRPVPSDPEAKPGRVAWVGFGILAVGLLAAGLHPDPRPWGLHQLAFLPRAVLVTAVFAFLALAWPSGARAAGRIAIACGARCVSSRLAVLGLAVAFALFSWNARLQFQFLGDGGVWLEKISRRGAFHHFEPLSTAIVRFVALRFSQPLQGAGLVSVICGAIYLVGTAELCRRLWADHATRGVGWLLLIVNPVLLLFFGYVESYPLLLALQVWCVVSWDAAQRSLAALAALIGLLGVAVACHLQALAWLLALPVLFQRRFGRGRWTAKLVASVAAVSVTLALAFALVRGIGAQPASLWSDLRGESALGSIDRQWFFSLGHALDMGNEIVLFLGAAFLLALGGRWGSDKIRELAVGFGLGPGLVLVLVPPRIGGARDWDLYAPLFVPAAIAAIDVGRRQWISQEGRIRASGLPIAGRAIGWAVVATTAWLGVHLSEARTAERMEVLQDRRGSFSNFARGYANEGLGIYYRDRDLQAARAAYRRAIEANPNNARYFNNLANIDIRLQDIPAARASFQKTYELGMREWFVLQNLGLCNLQLGRAAEAESLFTEMTRLWPKDWRARSGRAQALLDQGQPGLALQDLERALELAPQEADVHYLLGLVHRDLGRLDLARTAWTEALRLNAAHGPAREALARWKPSP